MQRLSFHISPGNDGEHNLMVATNQNNVRKFELVKTQPSLRHVRNVKNKIKKLFEIETGQKVIEV